MDEKELLQLAGRIYDLDTAVYKALGSDLGRVFPGNNRKKSIQKMLNALSERQDSHILRSDLALIANMIRTLDDSPEKEELLKEYMSITAAVEALPNSFESVDILDPEKAKLNTLDLDQRFAEQDHLIICIGRTFGASGSSIGYKLAEDLNINYYDSEIFETVLKRMQDNKERLMDHAATSHLVFSKEQRKYIRRLPFIKQARGIRDALKDARRYHGLPSRDAVFFNQSDLINELAAKEDFVIMGRCADAVLKNNNIPHISIFISAPLEQRVKHLMSVDDKLTAKAAKKLILEADKRHAAYYKFYTGLDWGHSDNYDLCINSAAYGLQGSEEMILKILPDRYKEKAVQE